MAWFSDNAWLAWVGLALVLGAIEVVSVAFVFVMLAGGALAGGRRRGHRPRLPRSGDRGGQRGYWAASDSSARGHQPFHGAGRPR